MKENRHGYHWAMLATPENVMKMPPATSGNRPMRSTRSTDALATGKETNRGQTTHSLAISTGTEAMPDDHVQALGEPVEAGGPGGDRQP